VEYSKFVKAFRLEYNKLQDANYKFATEIHEFLKSKHAKDQKTLEQFFSRWGDLYQEFSRPYQHIAYWSQCGTREDTTPPLWPHERHLVKDGKLYAPKKKDYPHATNRDTSFSDEGSDAGIEFRPKERQLLWFVTENNHACERAREGPLGRVFFQLLSKVTWTRGTGGSVWGNDEYHREADEEDGGGNFNKGRWGNQKTPISAAAALHRRRRRSLAR
jgi:hypothetical protein